MVNVLGFVLDTFAGNGSSKEHYINTRAFFRHVFLRILAGNLSTVNCKSSLEQVSCYASVLLCAGSECKRFCGNPKNTNKNKRIHRGPFSKLPRAVGTSPYNHLTYDVGKSVQNDSTFSAFPLYKVAKTT